MSTIEDSKTNPSKEFEANEKRIRGLFETCMTFNDLREDNERNDKNTSVIVECINESIRLSGFPDRNSEFWYKQAPIAPIKAPLYDGFPHTSMCNAEYFHMSVFSKLANIGKDSKFEEAWMPFLKNWKNTVKFLYTEQVNRFVKSMDRFDAIDYYKSDS